MLRSILLFNRTQISKGDIVLKTVLAIIAYGKGEYDIDKIRTELKKRFGIVYTDDEVRSYVRKLLAKRLVSIDNDKYSLNDGSGKGSVVIEQIEKDTELLITNVINRVTKFSRQSISSDENRICRINIRRALAEYYQMYGYAFLNLKKEAKKEEKEESVSIAKKGLSDTLGKSLIGALGDLLNNPSESERKTLMEWAKAFVTMQIMNLDPHLRDFKTTKIKDKSFILDTDVLLNALTANARYSKPYREMIKALGSAGCKIIIPQNIIDEVKDHLDAADKRYNSDGSQWRDFTDELLEDKVANVFIEDYVKTLRVDERKRDMTFRVYLRNFYDKNEPSLLMSNIKKALGSREPEIIFLDNLDSELQKKLKEKVQEYTVNSIKGSRRTEDENERIAETDAALYLDILQRNKDHKGNDSPLSKKCYLLTKTQKVEKCAKELGIYEKNVVCDPSALITILQETGVLSNVEVDYINLFENPFLTFVAQEVWGEIKPLLDAGASIKHQDLERLRIDSDARIDRILTCNSQEEKIQEAKRLLERGYFLGNDIAKLAEEKKLAEDDSLKKDKEIERLKAELKRLKNREDSTHKLFAKKNKQKHGSRKR